MRYLRSILVAAVSVGIATIASEEASAKKQVPAKVVPAQKKHHPFHGKVIHVHHKKTDEHIGSIVAKHHHHTADKVGDSTDATVERKFHVSLSTTFERIDVKNGKRLVSPATFRDVHKGSHVIIHHKGHHATDVKIVHHHRKAS